MHCNNGLNNKLVVSLVENKVAEETGDLKYLQDSMYDFVKTLKEIILGEYSPEFFNKYVDEALKLHGSNLEEFLKIPKMGLELKQALNSIDDAIDTSNQEFKDNLVLLLDRFQTTLDNIVFEARDAYETALDNGFEGTKQEWLEHLEGDSAYKLATLNGFTGTEAEWLDHLEGDSAYKIAVKNGYVGTQAEWLLYIRADGFIQSIQQFATNDAETNVQIPDYGTINSLQGYIKELFQNGGLPATPFATKALMTASALVDGDYAIVTDDTDNNGLYVKTAGVWVKSEYSQPAQKELIINDLSSAVDVTGVVTTGSFYDGAGKIASYAGTKRTELIAVKDADDLWIKANATALSALRYAFYDVNKVFISSVNVQNKGTDFYKVIQPVGTCFISASSETAYELKVERRAISTKEIIQVINRAKTVDDSVTSQSMAFPIIDRYWSRIDGSLMTANGVGYVATEKTDVSKYEVVLTAPNITLTTGDSFVFFDASGAFIGSAPLVPSSNYVNEVIPKPTGAVFFAASYRLSGNPDLSITLRGVTLDAATKFNATYPATKLAAESAVVTAKSTNYYQLGEDFEAIRAQRALASYGILFGGQSNAVGQAAFSSLATLGLPTTLAVNKWNGTSFDTSMTLVSPNKWGVWWSVLKRLKDLKPTTPIHYYNLSGGGTTLYDHWNPTTLPPVAVQWATNIKAMKATNSVNFKAVVWWQGESDKFSPKKEVYEKNLKDFINLTRGAIGDPLIPFIIMGTHKSYFEYGYDIRQAQLRASEGLPNVIFINPDDLPYTQIGDGHYDGAFFESIAPRIMDVLSPL